jgi:dynein heavy chain
LDIYKENETFLSYINNLNYTITSYNKIRETVAEVEYPLIERQIQAIDQQLSDAENKLTWSTSGKFYNDEVFRSPYDAHKAEMM